MMRTETVSSKRFLQSIWLFFLIVISLFTMFAVEAWAADLEGAADSPLLKRFNGSEIVGYDQKRFDEYLLQTSTYKRYDLEARRREFVKPPLKLAGQVTRIWYEAAGNASSAELAGNYRNELQSQGFRILYDSTADPDATNWSGFLNAFGELKLPPIVKIISFMLQISRVFGLSALSINGRMEIFTSM